jgi:hypothetical protein
MKTSLIGVAAFLFVAMLITTSMSGVVSAASEPDPLTQIKLETGKTNDWNGGSYVAVNTTNGFSVGWFAIVYGTEEHPAPITLVAVSLRYLGGAQVVNTNGNVIADHIPIPVVTVAAQSLFGLFEFDDTGIQTFFGKYGAGNGLFDFTSNRSLWFEGATQFEPVYKYVDLNRAWTLSPIDTTVDSQNQSKHFEFSLYALDVPYAKVWDPELGNYRNGTDADGRVAKIEFRFHITASAKEVTTSVPTYQVTLNGGKITKSEEIAPRNYTGTSFNTAFKYDHVVEGWDPYPNATSSHLMLENLLVFGVFIPEIVEEWYNVQFVKNHVENGSGTTTYETRDGAKTVVDEDQLPRNATLLTNNRITFMDSWQRVGALVWVSNVTVDGQERQAYYQIHAGSAADFPTEKRDGQVKLLVILGGYIYPMGTNIVHDPLFVGEALQLDFNEGLRVLIVLIAIGVAVIVIAMVVALLLLRRHNRRGQEKFTYRAPPEYRQP